MAGLGEKFLHFVQLGGVDVGIGVFLTINDTGLQPGEDFRETHRRGIRPPFGEHLHAPGRFRRPNFDSGEIGGCVDRAYIVGDVTDTVFPDSQDLVPVILDRRCDLRPEDFLLDPRDMGPVSDQERHVE